MTFTIQDSYEFYYVAAHQGFTWWPVHFHNSIIALINNLFTPFYQPLFKRLDNHYTFLTFCGYNQNTKSKFQLEFNDLVVN